MHLDLQKSTSFCKISTRIYAEIKKDQLKTGLFLGLNRYDNALT